MNKDEYNSIVNNLVSNGNDNNSKYTIVLNNDKPLFEAKDYDIIEGEPKYFEIDEYGRSIGAIALISTNTIPLVIKKKLKYPEPYGWTKDIEKSGCFERCHIIAYSLSAKLADKRNIFIGTETLNTSIMAKIEKKIKKYIMQNNVRVLYKVTVKYKANNQIPTGILIEAQSLDDDFSVCEFCFNVQKNVTFDYSNGIIIKDNSFLNKIVKIVRKSVKLTNTNQKRNTDGNKNYIINRKVNEFHLKDVQCSKLKGIEYKYLNETTATKDDLLDANLTPCKKCIV